jgi:uncharacterized protein YwgA
VERPDDNLTVRETVLTVIASVGGTAHGRTVIQKLSYFGGLALDQDLGHRAHYYGPYSRDIDVALENEAFAGDLDETMRTFVNLSGREGRAYIYALTDQGRTAVADIVNAKPEAFRRVESIVHHLGELVPDYQQHPLSLAAKVDLILEQQGAMNADEIPVVAKQLGWQVDDEEVDAAVKILVGVGRVAPLESDAVA